ncbi:MAG: ECF-type sigma factor [Vicinamibacterales bacterium]
MTRSTDSIDDDGARQRLDAHYSAAYEELRRLAAAVARRDSGRTLSPTGLVHEAWLKLAKSPDFSSESSLHFKRIAARAMRQVLVEAARRRDAQKRPQHDVRVEFDESALGAVTSSQVLHLDEALKALARVSERQAHVVEARFFGGLTVPEIAEAIGVSEVTVMRDWRVARAWLTSELSPA